MKTKLTIALMALTSLAYAGYFVEPVVSYVHPIDSKATVYGMPATVKYSDGKSFGINAGRTFGRFKLYGTYNKTQFTAQEIAVSTPYGEQKQSVSEHYEQHALLLNGAYTIPMRQGYSVMGTAGVGYGFSERDSILCEAGVFLSKELKDNLSVRAGATYRHTEEQIRLKHKTISQPDQWRLSLTISKKI